MNWFAPDKVLVGFEYALSDDESSDDLDHAVDLVRLIHPDITTEGGGTLDDRLQFEVITNLSESNEQVCVPSLSTRDVPQMYSSSYIPSWSVFVVSSTSRTSSTHRIIIQRTVPATRTKKVKVH